MVECEDGSGDSWEWDEFTETQELKEEDDAEIQLACGPILLLLVLLGFLHRAGHFCHRLWTRITPWLAAAWFWTCKSYLS